MNRWQIKNVYLIEWKHIRVQSIKWKSIKGELSNPSRVTDNRFEIKTLFFSSLLSAVKIEYNCVNHWSQWISFHFASKGKLIAYEISDCGLWLALKSVPREGKKGCEIKLKTAAARAAIAQCYQRWIECISEEVKSASKRAEKAQTRAYALKHLEINFRPISLRQGNQTKLTFARLAWNRKRSDIKNKWRRKKFRNETAEKNFVNAISMRFYLKTVLHFIASCSIH